MCQGRGSDTAQPGVGSRWAQAIETETIETWAGQSDGLAFLGAVAQGKSLGPQVQLLRDRMGTHSFQGDNLGLSSIIIPGVRFVGSVEGACCPVEMRWWPLLCSLF